MRWQMKAKSIAPEKPRDRLAESGPQRMRRDRFNPRLGAELCEYSPEQVALMKRKLKMMESDDGSVGKRIRATFRAAYDAARGRIDGLAALSNAKGTPSPVLGVAVRGGNRTPRFIVEHEDLAREVMLDVFIRPARAAKASAYEVYLIRCRDQSIEPMSCQAFGRRCSLMSKEARAAWRATRDADRSFVDRVMARLAQKPSPSSSKERGTG